MFGFLFFPNTSQAFDQRCWVKEDCDNYRASFGNVEAEEGFYSAAKNSDAKSICKTNENGKDVLGRDIGLCLPVGKSVTNISFGGRNEFTNIGDFLKFFYQYGFVVASVVAVIIIIVSGIMYIYSGGNSDTVGQAKKKIFGAVIGLVLLAFAYTLLNNINPYLVNLRMPGIWAINTMGIAPARCEQLDKNLKVGLATTPTTAVPYDQTTWFLPSNTTPTICGNDYYVDKTNGQFCEGNACTQKNYLCFKGINDQLSSCQTGKILGQVYSTSILDNAFGQKGGLNSLAIDVFFDYWGWIWSDDVEVWIMCGEKQTNGSVTGEKNVERNGIDDDDGIEINIDEVKKRQQFILNYNETQLNDLINECDDQKYLGFAIGFNLNTAANGTDVQHLIGLDENKNPIDLCDMPDKGVGGNWDETFCENLAHTIKPGIPKEYWITKEQMMEGFVMNLDVSKIPSISTDETKRERAYAKWGYKAPK